MDSSFADFQALILYYMNLSYTSEVPTQIDHAGVRFSLTTLLAYID